MASEPRGVGEALASFGRARSSAVEKEAMTLTYGHGLVIHGLVENRPGCKLVEGIPVMFLACLTIK